MRRFITPLVGTVAAVLVIPVAATSPTASATPTPPALTQAADPRTPTTSISTPARSTGDVRRPKGTKRFAAKIRFTEHGIPHVTAKNFGSLGFGSGYGAAQASICTLADTLVTGRGERSRWFGADGTYTDYVTLEASNLQIDAFVTDLHNRRVVEKLLRSKAGPGKQASAMVRGYVAGINKWLRTNKVTDPACKGDGYLTPDAKPIDVWYGVYLANLLASAGVFVKEIVDADPPNLDDPGLPEIPLRAAAYDEDDRAALLTALGKDPESPFGSNATAIGGGETSTGKGMLLGNPHFPWFGRYHFTQQHLTIPGRYDVAGASLVGSPVVNIGFNNDVAWSHTVSTAYRFTPYEYPLLGRTTYVTGSGPKELERRVVKVTVLKPNGKLATVREDLYRTETGYVVDSPATFMPWSVASVWSIRDANGEHLRTLDTFLDMGKAKNVRDLLRRQDKGGGMPWVNTTAADRKGNALYADHSVVPHVSNAMKNQCLTPVGTLVDQLAGLPGLDGTRAKGACAWGTDADAQRPGIFGPQNLPRAIRRDWVMNANDSYWLPNPEERLEGFATIIGCEECQRTMRTRMVSQYVIDRLQGKRKETPRSLAAHQHANRLRAAEVMRQGGSLDDVCDATGETEACAVLEAWDGRSETDSVGTHIFEEFIARVPDDLQLWRVQFDPDNPLNTPRGLNTSSPAVVTAMQEAIDALRQQKIPFDKPWGELQVAGDPGAPPIALGGGTGDSAGNANALASRGALSNTGRYRAVSYGSSHIQSIAFLPKGRLSTRTILTYGQDEDPASPYSVDQTRLFGQGKWVRFAWTGKQIKRDLVRTVRIRG
ncbi:MAG: peptidase S45 [Pimelobacter sp.]|nr:peptidase S45 [Pimelobacter sp.]